MTARILLVFFLLLMPSIVQAHMLPKQYATMKIGGNTANFVVSVPASALDNVDNNRDGLLSTQEIEHSAKAIERQFLAHFNVKDSARSGRPFLTLAMAPQSHGHTRDSDYLVILHRVKFETPPQSPTVSFDLFGSAEGEAQITIRATSGDRQEVAIMTKEQSEHTFFQEYNATPANFRDYSIGPLMSFIHALLQGWGMGTLPIVISE